jgi:hypothetical protein
MRGGSKGGRRGRSGSWGRLAFGLPLLPLLLSSCAEGTRIVSIPGQGFVAGLVYLDLDGDREPGGPDQALPGVGVRLVVAGTLDTLARATSDANGGFVFGAVPVGQYTVVVPEAPVFGDSLQVVRIDTADVSLGVNDTTEVGVSVSYPSYTVAEVRALPLGEKIFVEGLALNNSPAFGDSTVHLRDTTGAIRVMGTRGPLVAVGDSVRFLGRVAARNGQPVIENGQATIIQIVGPPASIGVTTAEAATANAGVLDAELVRFVNGTIADDTTTTANGDYQFTVDDGLGGAVLVVLDQDVGFTDMRTLYVPGVVLAGVGVLVPAGSGSWVLKPRNNNPTNGDLPR